VWTGEVKVEEGTSSVPAARRHIIRRPRLTRLLDESGARIILLVAPAGYGKTTLAREWLDDPSRRATWYRGGPASADVAALSVGLAAAAAEIVPGAGERMRARLRATDRPDDDSTVLAEMLSDDLAEWPEDAWLVIDDYHFANGAMAAETFVGTVASETPIRVLVASRRRPAWGLARRRVYGELLEIDRTSLAFSDDEARTVLRACDVSEEEVTSFLGRAGGWPAIVGMAAMTGEVGVIGELPATLFEYFAEELYQAVPPELKWMFCQLAMAPAMSVELAEALLGEDAATAALEHAAHLGIFSLDVTGSPEIHPLLRRFLNAKLPQYSRETVTDAASRIGYFYIDRHQWDEAFAVAAQFEDLSLLIDLVGRGLEEVLAAGRVATVSQWVEFASDRYVAAPILDLAEAELAFRLGTNPQTRILALRAAQGLQAQGAIELAAIALTRAGRAAHLEGQAQDALAHHTAALDLATSRQTAREALWGQFVTLVESQGSEAAEAILSDLEDKDDGHIDDLLRLRSGRYLLSLHRGLKADVDVLIEALPLLEKCANPMIRTSFLNSCAGGLALDARYEEAERIARMQIAEAESYRLRFVLPHGYLRLAAALCGLRRYHEAFRLLDEADGLAEEQEHGWISAAASITRGLALVATQKPEIAIRQTVDEPDERHGAPLCGEHVAFRALAFACNGDTETARALIQKAKEKSCALEVATLCTFAGAVAAHRDRLADADPRSVEAFKHAAESGSLDYFVISYRACPNVLESVVREGDPRLAVILERAHDHDLARTFGLEGFQPGIKRRRELLSPRERDVWELMATGLSNREIAGRLFLSESTIKVHVRHIFEKLGAKTRVEAVLKGQARFG
jgi:LuxR family transcriptional regulator, maltose regulon positive regulatory protein